MTTGEFGGASEQPPYLLLGKVLRPHGIRGELRMQILTDFPERIADLETLYLDQNPDSTQPTPYTLEHVRFHQAYALLKLGGVPSRTEAEFLRNYYVMVDLANAVPLEEGEFYVYQLVGLAVVTNDDESLGTVREVIETGANDVYVLDHPEKGEILIPAHDETILEIDFDAGTITVELPDGLLD